MAFLTATGALGLEERCYSSPKWCYLHHFHTIFNTKTKTLIIWSLKVPENQDLSIEKLQTLRQQHRNGEDGWSENSNKTYARAEKQNQDSLCTSVVLSASFNSLLRK